MDEFGYLSVLLSIIIGLAMTEILQALRRSMVVRKTVIHYWPTWLWAATLLLVCAQTWWAMFGLRNRHDWQFEQFLVLLAQVVVLYLCAGLVFPDFEIGETADLREHYFRQRRRFFGLLVTLVLISVYRDWVFHHALPDRTNLIFHGIFFSTGVLALLIAKEWYHKFNAVLICGVFMFYITMLFARLR